MQHYTLDQFRALTESGGIIAVTLRGDGGSFHIEAETLRGDAVLVPQRSNHPRRFADPRRALALLQQIGISEARIDAHNWHPEQAEQEKSVRPDRSEQMRAAHEAAELKRVLEERIRLAADPQAVWHEAEDVFAELETQHAG